MNIGLIIPLLDILFDQSSVSNLQEYSTLPVFEPNITYFKGLFYYYFQIIMQAEGKLGALKYVCVIIIASSLISNLFRYLAGIILANVRANVITKLRSHIYDKITSLHIGYFSNQRKGDLMARVTNDIQQIENTVVDSLKIILREPLMIIANFAFLFILSAKLTLYTLILLPVAGLFIAEITKRLKKKSTQGQESLGVITNIIEETLTGLRLIKAFTAKSLMGAKFNQQVQNYGKITVSISKKSELSGPVSEFLGLTTVSGLMLLGGMMILSADGSFSAAQFTTFLIVFGRILQPAKNISKSFSGIQRGLASGVRVFEVIDEVPAIRDNANPHVIDEFSQQITFKDVGFSYDDKEVLSAINFEVKKGETIALVGPSGGGKSTLADLIPRFYDAEQGVIAIDGINLKEVSIDSLRKQMGIVTQESILFNDTIANNISFGIENPKEEDIIHAAKIANAHEFIMANDQGYQTVTGDQGTKLSGGQRQRLSIARAIMKNPPILILDEATSALDTESEKLVQDALSKLMENRTSIVIAHRLSTIQHADRILVIKAGQIVEQGTHSTLISQNGLYNKLIKMQDIGS
jgi:subfamily B ATP-binding cassette protein MsbA